MSQTLGPGIAGIEFAGEFFPAIATRYVPPGTDDRAGSSVPATEIDALKEIGYYWVERPRKSALLIPFTAAALVVAT